MKVGLKKCGQALVEMARCSAVFFLCIAVVLVFTVGFCTSGAWLTTVIGQFKRVTYWDGSVGYRDNEEIAIVFGSFLGFCVGVIFSIMWCGFLWRTLGPRHDVPSPDEESES
jgi:hypothetical protein